MVVGIYGRRARSEPGLGQSAGQERTHRRRSKSVVPLSRESRAAGCASRRRSVCRRLVPMPAPLKFTPALATKFVELVRRGNFRETASAQCGIDSRTLRGWLSKAAAGDERFQQFVSDVDAAEAVAEGVMVGALYRAAETDWKAAAWLLERRGSKRWG